MKTNLIKVVCLILALNTAHVLANVTTNNERAKEIKSSLIQKNDIKLIDHRVLNNYSQPKVVKYLVHDDISIEDVEEAMESTATDEGIRSVGMLPLSEMVELQTGEKQRFLKIYQYMSPRDSVALSNYNSEFSAFLPIRIALSEDRNGRLWLYSIDTDSIFRSEKTMSPEVDELLSALKSTINAIMNAGATGNF